MFPMTSTKGRCIGWREKEEENVKRGEERDLEKDAGEKEVKRLVIGDLEVNDEEMELMVGIVNVNDDECSCGEREGEAFADERSGRILDPERLRGARREHVAMMRQIELFDTMDV